MQHHRIHADSFVLKARRIRIYRVRHRGSATVLWVSGEHMLGYLRHLRQKRLQAKEGR